MLRVNNKTKNARIPEYDVWSTADTRVQKDRKVKGLNWGMIFIFSTPASTPFTGKDCQ